MRRHIVRLTQPLLDEIHRDLDRHHAFAAERVGFLTCGAAVLADDGTLLVGQCWLPVDDGDYIDDPTVGASIGATAFRKILQRVYHQPAAIFHVHRHEHHGSPRFSRTDMRSMWRFVPDFFNVCDSHPHGAIVLSRNSAYGALWLSKSAAPVVINAIEISGAPLLRWSAS